MKKIFVRLGVLLIVSSSTLPMIACTFNFYVNRVTESIAKSFANETSQFLKGLVMAKTMNVETNSAIKDMFNNNVNAGTYNESINTTVNNWGDLEKAWGQNGKIKTDGFNQDQFIVADNTKNSLTTQINSLNSDDKKLGYISDIKLLNMMRNPMLYNLIFENNSVVKKPIISFLTTLQNPKATGITLLLQNLINNYQSNFLSPLQQMFGNLIDGRWSSNQATTPSNFADLTTFMEQWNDPQGQPYSNWINHDTGKWDINKLKIYSAIGAHNPENWSLNDNNLYHGGTLINYLFWKISSDYHIAKPETKYNTARYLGDIISDYLNGTSIDQAGLFKDLSQYLSHIIENPQYLILLIEGIIPVIKTYFLKMPDIAKGVKHLTLGSGFPTNEANNSYNLLDIINNIEDIINNPTTLRTLLEKLLGWSKDDNLTNDTFTYDIKINTNYESLGKISIPLGAAMQGKILEKPIISESEKNNLIDQILNYIPSIKGYLNSALSVITKTADQYSGKTGIDINMVQLQTFLFDPNLGILNLLQQDGPNSVIEPLKKMITAGYVITDNDLEKLYQGLGGNTNKNDPKNWNIFRNNSIIDLLQKNFNNLNSPINKILQLLTTTYDGTNQHKGITDFIIENNNNWINDNYTKYFDLNNTSIGNTFNIKTTKTLNNGVETINLSYDFTYTIKGTTYHFRVACFDQETPATFKGTRNFKFKVITLLNS